MPERLDIPAGWGHLTLTELEAENARDAINALADPTALQDPDLHIEEERQEPPPDPQDAAGYECPTCGCRFVVEWLDDTPAHRAEFCPRCGATL